VFLIEFLGLGFYGVGFGSERGAGFGWYGMTFASPVVGDQRCAIYDVGTGRCQLLADHRGAHASDIGGGTCLTWAGHEMRQQWRTYPAPLWLIALPWAPGFQPAVQQADRSSLV
jgi:hypothetical protein